MKWRLSRAPRIFAPNDNPSSLSSSPLLITSRPTGYALEEGKANHDASLSRRMESADRDVEAAVRGSGDGDTTTVAVAPSPSFGSFPDDGKLL